MKRMTMSSWLMMQHITASILHAHALHNKQCRRAGSNAAVFCVCAQLKAAAPAD